MQSHLSQLIEFKEVSESNRKENKSASVYPANAASSQGASGSGVSPRIDLSNEYVVEKDIYEAVFDLLIKILKERKLNGRLKDTRHDLRNTALIILNLFQDYAFQDENYFRQKELITV